LSLVLRTVVLVVLAFAAPAAASERLGGEECEIEIVDDTPPLPQVSRHEAPRAAPAQVAPAPGAPRPQNRVCADVAVVSCAAGARDAAPEIASALRALDPFLLAVRVPLAPVSPSVARFAAADDLAPPARSPDRVERPPRA
jgi:hypothetical protein